MKNKLSDLNDHLFAQLERLSNEDLSAEQIELELKRGEAMVLVSDQLLRMTALQIQAAKIAQDCGMNPVQYLPTAVSTLVPPATATLARFPPFKIGKA